MKYLVIGSNSFSGSNFINFLLNKNHKVVGVSRSTEIKKEFLIYKKNQNIQNFKFYKINLNRDLKKLFNIINKFKPDIVVNYAAQGMVAQSWKSPEDWYQTNLVSQSIFYRKIQEIKFIKKIIHVSTPEVYGNTPKLIKPNYNFNPSTPYAISRAAMDLHLFNLYKYFKLPIIFTRTANVYGPGQQLYRIVTKTIMSIKKRKYIYLHGGGKSLRSFIFVDDASEATYIISKKGKIGSTYHISGKNFISIKSLVKKIFNLSNLDFKKFCKIEVDRIGKDHSYKLNQQKTFKLNWKPRTDIDTGLLKTFNWVENNFKSLKKLKLEYKHKK